MALEVEIEGSVQGVGFRPWAARLQPVKALRTE